MSRHRGNDQALSHMEAVVSPLPFKCGFDGFDALCSFFCNGSISQPPRVYLSIKVKPLITRYGYTNFHLPTAQ